MNPISRAVVERPGGLGFVCDPSGPQGPAIRIRVPY